MSSQISARELDLIIKELERLNGCYNKLSEKIDRRLDNKVDIRNEKWKYLLIFGCYGFTMFVLGLLLKVHFGV
jgi:hypothetical protein